jgi:hypothetical protein
MTSAFNLIRQQLILHFQVLSDSFMPKWNKLDERIRDMASIYIKKFIALAYPDPNNYYTPSITIATLMKCAPSCITGLLYRLKHGNINTHLKYNERLTLSRIARASGVPFSELKEHCLQGIARAYPGNEHKAAKKVLQNLEFAYKFNTMTKMPSCQALIEDQMCGKLKQASRNGTCPQRICCNEIKARSFVNVQVLYTPMFYVNQLKRVQKRKIEYQSEDDSSTTTERTASTRHCVEQ